MLRLLRILLCVVALAAGCVLAASTKQLYRVTAPRAVFDATLPLFRGRLDVWRTTPQGDGDVFEVQAYATDDQIAQFRGLNATTVERDAVDTSALLESRALDRAACASNSRRRRLANGTARATVTTPYVDDAFFDCFREASEIFAFLDALVAANPKFLSKIRNVTTTFEGRTVPGYKLSTGIGRRVLYTQALIHAREWVAGSSTLYALASLLDHLRAGDASTNAIFGEFDWHFVPVLNLDGYLYSWSDERLWRKSRRKLRNGEFGVDLNRNFPPESFFGQGGEAPDSESYPGTAVLSEPETAGVWNYLKRVNASGVLDMHSHGGLVMRAYGNQRGSPPAPYGPKLKVLGDLVAQAAGRAYESQTSAQLYEAYGCFDDAVFQVLDRPVLTIEMAGDSFVADEATIRPAGQNMFRAFVAFAQQIPFYWRGLSADQQQQAPNAARRDALGFAALAESRGQHSD